MKKYILAVTLVFLGLPLSVGYGDVPNYEQKPHLEIKCPCGASFITYEWLKNDILSVADKFMEKHPCSYIIPISKKMGFNYLTVRPIPGKDNLLLKKGGQDGTEKKD